jgi:hypothetical protein
MTVMSGHRRLSQLGKPSDLINYVKVCCCRNPYDRFISLWKIKEPKLTLDQFIDKIESGKLSWYPLRTQLYWVAGRDGSLQADELIVFEDFQNSVERFLAKMNLPNIPLPHLRKTLNRKPSFKQYFTSRSQVSYINATYRDDFTAFGYERMALGNETVGNHS